MDADASERDFVDGYRDGRDPECPPPNGNRSACYEHSFMVGRAEIERRPLLAMLSRLAAAEALRKDAMR